MNQHTPTHWWWLLPIVISTRLSVTTSMHPQNPSDVGAHIARCLSAPRSFDFARNTQSNHFTPHGHDCVLKKSPSMAEYSSVGLVKNHNEYDKNALKDLPGLKRIHKAISSLNIQHRDSEDHEAHALRSSEQDDIDTFKKSCMIFENDFIPSVYYATTTGEESIGTLVLKLKRYNKEITRILVKRLSSKDDNAIPEAFIQQIHKDPSEAKERYNKDNDSQLLPTKCDIPGSNPQDTNERSFMRQKTVILEGLKECLQQIKFPKITDAIFSRRRAREEEEPVVKSIFQAIEYMHKYNLITPNEMLDFFDDQTVQILGHHLASIQLFGESQKVYHFTPDIEDFKDDWKTYHVHKCLNDLPENKQRRIIHSALGTFWRALENGCFPGSNIHLKNDMIKRLFAEEIVLISMDVWENVTRALVQEFSRKKHSMQDFPEESQAFEYKIKFYMLEFVLRYSPFKEQIPEKSGIDKSFMVKYFRVKTTYRDSYLNNKAKQCFYQFWKQEDDTLDSHPFNERQWNDKRLSLLKKTKQLKKLIEEPSSEMLKENRDIVWIPMFPNIDLQISKKEEESSSLHQVVKHVSLMEKVINLN